MVVMYFVTQFTHVFFVILEFIIENKTKIFRENWFANVVSDLKKNYLCVQKTNFRKKFKN